MTSGPLVSVCIPVYNGEKHVGETIRSVLDQTYRNIELIVQDNASTDGTWSILHDMAQQDARISIERNAANYGMAGNWNIAINRSRGDYVMLLSADDLLLPEFLERCLAVFGAQPVDAVSTNHFYLKQGTLTKRKMRVAAKIYQHFAGLVLLMNPFSINFTLFTRQLLEQSRVGGNFFAKRYYTCDYDLWIRLGTGDAKIAYTDEALGIYRVHDENLSRQVRRMSRQTALTVLSHKTALKAQCRAAYRATLFRFLLRGIRNAFVHRARDARLLRTIRAALFR